MQREVYTSASSQNRNDSHYPVSRLSGVTVATPAKRITFFKSGDPQFIGVRMAIHKRSFKCFDALLDDLSQKVPLPFGVRTITTPKGTHLIQHMDQLQDGGCYLCSDRHYVKPINMEVAGKRPAVWQHSHPQHVRRKPSRPEEPPSGHSGHHLHRQPKRITLVRNNDPAVRRSIVLSRKMVRSLRVFMDEISELMQCHVRKLYTMEGRKVDSIQSLMQCPNVLVCVGREPFKPILLENLRKHSEEKLPGLAAISSSSICSEGHGSRKNVNFGLETKKSIIHPRSDSSTKSTRFSLSSEKSYPNGSGMTPGQTACVTKDVVMNDDIEKRVLVNKDGSLSVEMKVRFRLINDETLQWSTEIKKLMPSVNESTSLKDREPQCIQSKVDSDLDYTSACEAEDTSTKLHQNVLEESCCHDCCSNNQGYDIWKNPIHKDHGTRSCCSSVGASHNILHQKTSMESVRSTSRSSEEYTERVIEKASCFQESVEEGDTRIKYCSISRCCSRSEVSATTTKSKCNIPTDDSCESNHENFKVRKYPISATCSSSKGIESFKKDHDDDYDELSPSEGSQSDNPVQENQCTCVHCSCSLASQIFHLSPVPPGKISSCSANESKKRKYRRVYGAPGVPIQQAVDSARSSVLNMSPRFYCCHCRQSGQSTPGLVSKLFTACGSTASEVNSIPKANENRPDSGTRSVSAVSTASNVSGKSHRSVLNAYEGVCKGSLQDVQEAQVQEVADVNSHKSEESVQLRKSTKCPHCSSRQNRSSDIPVQNNASEIIRSCCESAFSDLSDLSGISKKSNKSNCTPCEVSEGMEFDERVRSAMSVKSNASAMSKINSPVPECITTTDMDNLIDEEIRHFQTALEKLKGTHENEIQDDQAEENCPIQRGLAMSSMEKSSRKSVKSPTSINHHQTSLPTSPQTAATPGSDTFKKCIPSMRSTSAMSKTSKTSLKSNPCLDKGSESVSKLYDISSLQKTNHLSDDMKSTTQNSLAVTSPSPKIKRGSPTSSTANALNTTEKAKLNSLIRSSKCGCALNSDLADTDLNSTICAASDQSVQGVYSNSPARKSKSAKSEDPLSPSSTTSVSLGLEVENNTSESQVLNDDKSLPELNSPRPCTDPVSKTRDNKESRNQVTTPSSMRSAMSSALSASSHKSPSRTSQPVENNLIINACKCGSQVLNETKTITNGLNMSGKSSQSHVNSRKSTPSKAVDSEDEDKAKTENQSSTMETNKKSQNSKVKQKTHEKEEQAMEQNSTGNSDAFKGSSIRPAKSSNKDIPEVHLNSAGMDLLRERTSGRSRSRGSKSSTSSHKHKEKNICNPTLNRTEDLGEDQLIPYCLPNASPIEVVNDWLKSIPLDGPMYEMEDEFHEQHEPLPQIPAIMEGESFQNEIGKLTEQIVKMPQDTVSLVEADPGMVDGNEICDEPQESNETNQATSIVVKNELSPKFSKKVNFTNQCPSSIQVMKALLNPKLDRCNSLPEVSPTYGKKLSTSAKGLLDCLANLQVIDSDARKDDDRYNKLINIIQSLWIYEQSETEHDKHKVKDHHFAEDEFNPRSSSGIDLSSGSTGSLKGSVNYGIEKSENAVTRVKLIEEQQSLLQIQKDTHVEGYEDSAILGNKGTSHASSDPLTPDIAERVRCSPEEINLAEETQKDEDPEEKDEVNIINANKTEIDDIAATSSNRSSGNDSNVLKSLTDKETDSPENTNSGTSSSGQRGILSKRVSQDPDPIWVLSLLKKLEKQFMSHYANAIAEFKVRWDLNDNDTLDRMARELKEEVHKRIQSTINRELQKIQSRAGKTPRPPMNTLSGDSSAQTEQRRRRLKVMQNKLIKASLSKSEDMNTASGTEFSDQRSDDEYCPCDVCMKKKMASRVVQRAEALSLAPVLMDFDLRKILQTKKTPLDTNSAHCELAKLESDISKVQEQDLQVVSEEAKVCTTKINKCDGVARNGEEIIQEVILFSNTGTEIKGEKEVDEKAPSIKTDNKEAEVEERTEEKELEMQTGIPEGEQGSGDRSTNKAESKSASLVDNMADVDPVEGGEATEENPDVNTESVEEDPSNKIVSEIMERENSQIKKESVAKKSDTEEEQESEDDMGKKEEAQDDDGKENTSEMAEDETGQVSESDPADKTIRKSVVCNETSEDQTNGESEEENKTPNVEENEPEDKKSSEISQDGDSMCEEGQRVTLLQSSGEELEQVDTEDGGRTNEKPQNEIETEKINDMENQSQGPCYHCTRVRNGSKDVSCDEDIVGELRSKDLTGSDSDCRLIQQLTKTSVESQPGSMEYSKDLTGKEKLQAINSLMESSDSQ